MNQIQSKYNEMTSIKMVGEEISLHDLFELGNTFHKKGELDQAETVFREILKIAPDHPGALHFLGVIARQCGKLESAIKLIKKAVEVSPNYHTAYNNLGQTYRDMGDIDKAKEAFNRAIDENPKYALAHFNLALIAIDQRKFEGAISLLKISAKLEPRHTQTHLEIGKIFARDGEKYNAQIALKTVLKLESRHTEARCLLAQIIMSISKLDDALKEYEIVLKQEPTNISALNGIGRIHNKKGQFKLSLESLYKAFQIDKNNTETLTNLGNTLQSIGDIDTASEYFIRVIELAPNAIFAEKCLLFITLNNLNYTHDEFFDLHIKLRGRHDKPQFANKSFPARIKDPNKKIKLGYLSSDFRTHVVSLNMLPLIMNHDHEQFEIYLYSHSKNDDRITKALSDASDHFEFVNAMNDEELANLIEEHKIDVFVTLAGRFDENRPLVSTYRPAPIQVSFHDCATSGLDAMDYYLTDSVIHPLNTEEKFTEHLYRLPTYYQYPIHSGLPPINDAPAIQNGYITFCCFNKPEKIGEEVIKLWGAVLQAIPNSRLLLKYFSHYSEPLMRERTIERFRRQNISEDRLILNAATDTRLDHLTVYHQADIALDPFPFNGATTTFEALTMGVPVITLTGDHFVSRVATSLVTHVGRSDFAADSYDQYISIAKDLANNIDNLNLIRRSLRQQLHESSLCNGAEYAKNVEMAFRSMWKTWCKTGGYKGN